MIVPSAAMRFRFDAMSGRVAIGEWATSRQCAWNWRTTDRKYQQIPTFHRPVHLAVRVEYGPWGSPQFSPDFLFLRLLT